MSALMETPFTYREPAIPFAGVIGLALCVLAGVAGATSAHHLHTSRGGPVVDRLQAVEALLIAERDGTAAIAYPKALLARRDVPAVAQIMRATDRRFADDRRVLAARRDAIIDQIADARAVVDLNESRRTVLRLQLNGSAPIATSAAATARARSDEQSASREAATASRRLTALARAMASLSERTKADAAARLDQVRARLRRVS